MNHIYVKRADSEEEYVRSAEMLTENEPWKSLGRSYDYSVAKVREPDGELFVVYVEEKIAGCILLELHGVLKGFIRSFCIDAKFRGRGIGAKVIGFAEKYILQQTPNVFVFAASTNEGAIRFYKNQGYKQIGLIEDFIETGSDELLFRKTIGSQNNFVKVNVKEEI